jgi:regulator of sigma E protease
MIFIHELGHFLMAKKVGITVHEFALGFGPKLLQFGKKKKTGPEDEDPAGDEPKETEYCLRLVPFGGFVSMEGEDNPGDPDDPGNFNNKSVIDRFKVIVAGCVMNYAAGIILLLLVGFIWGIALPNPPAVVGDIITGKGFPMENSGIQKGDKIVRVNDTPIENFDQLSTIISPMTEGQDVQIFVDRKGTVIPFNLKIKYDPQAKRGMLGFAPVQGFMGFKFEKQPPMVIVTETFRKTYMLTIMPAIIVQKLMSREMTPKQIREGTAGPIGIGQMLFDISKQGIPSLLYMCAILSILIGAFNLIPFPALDGARAFFLGIEWIRKKPLDPAKEGMMHQLGFIVLIILVLIVSYNDVLRLIKGGSLFK